MQIRVLFFGVLKDLAGHSWDLLMLPDEATAGDVLEHYETRMPSLKGKLSSIAVSVNQEYCGPEAKLHSGDEVALLPPVSGGSARAAIVRERIDTAAELEKVKQPEDGAAVVFEGVVRNHSRGRRTLFLEYEAYEEMARKQMESLAEQALTQFQIRDVAGVHRLGRGEIGETSGLFILASAHRAAAFETRPGPIDTLKQQLPILKKKQFSKYSRRGEPEPVP